jgi:uncharacterized integral membrane protein
MSGQSYNYCLHHHIIKIICSLPAFTGMGVVHTVIILVLLVLLLVLLVLNVVMNDHVSGHFTFVHDLK